MAESSSSPTSLSLADSFFLEHLEETLSSYMDRHEIRIVFDQLRGKISEHFLFHSEEQRLDKLKSLHAVMHSCNACGDLVSSSPQQSAWNISDPDLTLVTDVPLTQVPSHEFLLAKLKEAGFSSRRCSSISVVRCSPASKGIAKESFANCVTRYLFHEISLMQPGLILACGSFASSAVLQRKVKITEDKGNIFWVGPWAIMPIPGPAWSEQSQERSKDYANILSKAFSFLYGK